MTAPEPTGAGAAAGSGTCHCSLSLSNVRPRCPAIAVRAADRRLHQALGLPMKRHMRAPWKATCALGLACAVVAWAPAAHAAPMMTEHKPGATGSLTGVAAGPGQHLFFTALADPGALGRIDADGGGLVEWIGGDLPNFSNNRKPHD